MSPDTHRDSNRLSRRVAQIEPQKIRVMFDLAAQQDGDLVHLEIGEPDFDTPSHVIDAAHEAATCGRTRYTANAGILELRRALAEKIQHETGLAVDPDSEIAVTTGGVEAYHLALQTVVDPGSTVVIPTPAWPNPISQTKLAGGDPVPVPMPASDGFEPDPDRIVDEIGPETAAVLITSPSNPTGQVFDEAAIDRVVETAVDHEAYVIADEVYRELSYGETPPSVASVTDHEEWVLTINSFSKVYAMTGWRVGWIAGPADVIETLTAIHEYTTSCVNTPAQYGALEALTGPQEPFQKMKETFRKRRDYVVDRLSNISGVSVTRPDGAFYAFVDVHALEGSSMDVAKRLLYEYDVVTAPGDAFGPGGGDHIRLSFANDIERLELGLDRFESMVRNELDSLER